MRHFRQPVRVRETPPKIIRLVDYKTKRATRRARKLKNAQARHMRKVA